MICSYFLYTDKWQLVKLHSTTSILYGTSSKYVCSGMKYVFTAWGSMLLSVLNVQIYDLHNNWPDLWAMEPLGFTYVSYQEQTCIK